MFLSGVALLGGFQDRARMAATALAVVLQDTYIQRIAICAVDDFVEALG